MKKKIELQQRTPEWYAWREGKIGCSDVAAILGKSPWTTPLQLYRQKIGEEKRAVSRAMERGIAFEGEALDQIRSKIGVSYSPACFESSSHPFFIASLDGWHDGSGAVEIKIPNEDDHLLALTKIVPSHYVPQCQAIMLVTESREMLYVSYDPASKSLADVLIKRDDGYCEKMLKLIEEFYNKLQNGEPPESMEKDYIQFEDLQGLSSQLQEASQQAKFWKDKSEALKEEAIRLTGNQNAYLGDMKITKSIRLGNVDYKAVPQLKGVDLSGYRKGQITSYYTSWK